MLKKYQTRKTHKMDEVVVWLIYHHHTDQSYYLCYSVREPHWNNCQTCGKPEHTGSTSNYSKSLGNDCLIRNLSGIVLS